MSTFQLQYLKFVNSNNGHRKMQEKKIATFAFFSIEAKGIQSHEYKPRATELCIIAIERQNLISNINKQRIANKIRLHFNPKKSTKNESQNSNTSDQISTNDDLVQLLLLFLQRLPQPICLIAHNGNKFDFRLLQAEIGCNLPESILCADSYAAFQSILPNVISNLGQSSSNGENRRNVITSKSVVDEDEVKVIAIKEQNIESKQNGNKDVNFPIIDLTEDSSSDETSDGESRDSNIIIEPSSSSKMVEETEKIEINTDNNEEIPDGKCDLNGFANAVKRPLEEEEAKNVKKSKMILTTVIKSKISDDKTIHDCSLSVLHEGLTGFEMQKEFLDAEIGVSALVRVCQVAGDLFCEWIDVNAVSLNTIESFW